MRLTGIAVVVAIGLFIAPHSGTAQPAEKIARIALLRSEKRPIDDRLRQNFAALRAGLHDEGFAEGRHYRIDYHSPASEADVAKLAQALVRERSM